MRRSITITDSEVNLLIMYGSHKSFYELALLNFRFEEISTGLFVREEIIEAGL